MAMPGSRRGFTLIEIMVVMVLIGILASFAVLSIGGGPRDRLLEEGQRLTSQRLTTSHEIARVISGTLDDEVAV